MTSLHHIARDERISCDSILVSLEIRDFLQLVRDVYEKRGGIEGQRPALRSKTAKTIRERLVSDLIKGALVPPIVIGALVDEESREKLVSSKNPDEVVLILRNLGPPALSIIDGMQRTTAFLEASKVDESILNKSLRIEVWASENISSLIYRMLVLNTGQIPWEISRQLETIYSQLIVTIKSEVPAAEIYMKDERQRRSAAGQYQASTIVRLFLAFSSRRAEFDIKDRVAEDFARLDAIESSSHEEFTSYFIRVFELLVLLDGAFSHSVQAPKPHTVRIADGREIFQTDTALIGFFVAVAIHLFDEPGFASNWEEVPLKLASIEKSMQAFCARLKSMEPVRVTEFLQLEILNERLEQRSGQVGRFERDLFARAFSLLLKRSDDLEDMKPCWVR